MNRVDCNIYITTCKKGLLHSQQHNQATRIELTTLKATYLAKLIFLLKKMEKIVQNFASGPAGVAQ